MNFFELFQILYAVHFVLGSYIALLMLRWVPLALLSLLVSSPNKVTIASVLAALWYFVWFGSILFALRGRFPIVGPRAFSILLGCVYVGFAILFYSEGELSVSEFVFQNQFIFLVIGALLLLSISGAACLPTLKSTFDADSARRAREREQRLDEQNPWDLSHRDVVQRPK